MKKVLVTLMIACVAVSVFAKEKPKSGLGVQIGWTQPILRLNSPDNPSYAKDSLSNKVKMNGVKVGLVYDESFFAGFGSSIGINYTFATANTAWRQKNIISLYPQTHTRTQYHALELFIDWQYKFEVAKEAYLMLYSGPTIQCGLVYNTITEEKGMDGKIDPNATTEYMHYKDNNTPDEDLTRLNVTWGVGAGIQYKNFFIRGGYDFGLINPYKHADFENGNHTRGRLDQWSIKLGAYMWYK